MGGMEMRTGIVICNYNMPTSTDMLAHHIKKTVKEDYVLCVVDNGSDIQPPSEHTTLRLPKNVQMTKGFMMGVDQLDRITRKSCDYYWLIITSVEFVVRSNNPDPVKMLTDVFDDNTFAVQPSLIKTGMETTAWDILKPRIPPIPRRVFATDYCCTMYRADKFNSIGRWNENLSVGWGLEETFYLARKEGWEIFTHDGYTMKHRVAIGYELDRMGETYSDRVKKAKKEMDKEFIPKYGKDYFEVINHSYRNSGEF